MILFVTPGAQEDPELKAQTLCFIFHLICKPTELTSFIDQEPEASYFLGHVQCSSPRSIFKIRKKYPFLPNEALGSRECYSTVSTLAQR